MTRYEPHCEMADQDLSKQPAGLKLTSMTGEQTFFEATVTGSTGEERTAT